MADGHRRFGMKLTTDCPNCGAVITSKRCHQQDWFFCESCQSIFFSCEGLRENWPSLHKTFMERRKKQPAVA